MALSAFLSFRHWLFRANYFSVAATFLLSGAVCSANEWHYRLGSTFAKTRVETTTTSPWFNEGPSSYPDTFTLTNWRAIINELNTIEESQVFSSRAFVRISARGGINLATLAKMYEELSCPHLQNCLKVIFLPGKAGDTVASFPSTTITFFVLNLANFVAGDDPDPLAAHQTSTDLLSIYYPAGDTLYQQTAASNGLHPKLNAPAGMLVPIIFRLTTAIDEFVRVPEDKIFDETAPLIRRVEAVDVGPPEYVRFRTVWGKIVRRYIYSFYPILIRPEGFVSLGLSSSRFRRPTDNDIAYEFFVQDIDQLPSSADGWQQALTKVLGSMK